MSDLSDYGDGEYGVVWGAYANGTPALCIKCGQLSGLSEAFDPVICESCMNIWVATGVWPTGGVGS